MPRASFRSRPRHDPDTATATLHDERQEGAAQPRRGAKALKDPPKPAPAQPLKGLALVGNNCCRTCIHTGRGKPINEVAHQRCQITQRVFPQTRSRIGRGRGSGPGAEVTHEDKETHSPKHSQLGP
eukprot:12331943-Alexandrium_andersonii.AAC.1